MGVKYKSNFLKLFLGQWKKELLDRLVKGYEGFKR